MAEPNAKLRALQRTLNMRGAELEDAHRHIAGLEAKLLKLKEYRRELKRLKGGEATPAQVRRAQSRPDIARALSSSNTTGENNLEKI